MAVPDRWAQSTVHRPGAIPDWVQVYTLCRVVRSIAIAASSDMDMSLDSFVLMFWDFYLPLIGECMVSRGCSRLEERGSIYLVDADAIIEVRGEKVLASTLDGSRLWRRGLGDQVVLSCVESFGVGNLLEISFLYHAATV
jgi:hypothetical protein